MIQPATATTDSLIGDLLSLDLPTAAPPIQYGEQSTAGQYLVVIVMNSLWLNNCVGYYYNNVYIKISYYNYYD